MITITFYRDKDMNYKRFSCEGHAGYAEYGYDIVCAAISSLSVNTVNSIDKLTDDDIKVQTDDAGLLKLEMITNSDSSQLLLASLKLGLQGIANTYGNEYVNILNWFQGGAMYHVENESSVICP